MLSRNSAVTLARDYGVEKNRVLKEQLDCRALRLTDDQRRLSLPKTKDGARSAASAPLKATVPEDGGDDNLGSGMVLGCLNCAICCFAFAY